MRAGNREVSGSISDGVQKKGSDSATEPMRKVPTRPFPSSLCSSAVLTGADSLAARSACRAFALRAAISSIESANARLGAANRAEVPAASRAARRLAARGSALHGAGRCGNTTAAAAIMMENMTTESGRRRAFLSACRSQRRRSRPRARGVGGAKIAK